MACLPLVAGDGREAEQFPSEAAAVQSALASIVAQQRHEPDLLLAALVASGL